MSRSSSTSSSRSSSYSSSSSTPSPQSSPVLLGSFDPFAIHPFTNCGGPNASSIPPGGPISQPHILPHPSALQLDAPVPSYSSHPNQYNASGIAHPTSMPAGAPGYGSQGSQTHAGGGYKPIFVPFRQETSSPDLSDVLRRKRMGL